MIRDRGNPFCKFAMLLGSRQNDSRAGLISISAPRAPAAGRRSRVPRVLYAGEKERDG